MANDAFNMSTNPILTRRLARGWSQAELAQRAGISRAAVSAIEGERLSPSVAAALALASVLECSVEELFGRVKPASTGEPNWAWAPRGGTSRYWEVLVGGERRLYPVEAASVNSTPHDGVWRDGLLRENGFSRAEATLVLATCDPAAGLLAAEYFRESGFRLLVFPRGGRVALELLHQGLVHVAGVHYSTSEEPTRNAEMVRQRVGPGCQLLNVAKWEAGIALPSGDHSRSPESVARRHLRWAIREPGSGARECLDQLLGSRQLEGREVGGHASVAEAVRSGWAEAGVCVRFSAEDAGLNFLPVRAETLELCFPTVTQHDARIQALVRLLRSRAHRRLLSELPGYDPRRMGEVTSL
jgi:molybdate-binding protein/transcriptional regulator with XRE-family HTH domain